MFRTLLHIHDKALFVAIGLLASIMHGYRHFSMTVPGFHDEEGAVQGCILLELWGVCAITALLGSG